MSSIIENRPRQVTKLPLWQRQHNDGFVQTECLKEPMYYDDNEMADQPGEYRVTCEVLALESAERIEAAGEIGDNPSVINTLAEYFLACQRANIPLASDKYHFPNKDAHELVLQAAAKALGANDGSNGQLGTLLEEANIADNYYLAGSLLLFDFIGKNDNLQWPNPDATLNNHRLLDLQLIDVLYAFYTAQRIEEIAPQFPGTNIQNEIRERLAETAGYLEGNRRGGSYRANHQALETFLRVTR